MNRGGFALLWSKILDSSIWMESKEARLVWITMLAMKDSDGQVIAAPAALAHRARVEVEECLAALKIFLAPDPQSQTKEEEGRRIREVPGGWQIINHELYRFSTEAKRAFWREQKRKEREAKGEGERRKRRGRPKGGGGPSAREREHEKAEENGQVAEAERLSGTGGPGIWDGVPEGRAADQGSEDIQPGE